MTGAVAPTGKVLPDAHPSSQAGGPVGQSAGPQRPDPGMVVITDAVTCRCSLASRTTSRVR